LGSRNAEVKRHSRPCCVKQPKGTGFNLASMRWRQWMNEAMFLSGHMASNTLPASHRSARLRKREASQSIWSKPTSGCRGQATTKALSSRRGEGGAVSMVEECGRGGEWRSVDVGPRGEHAAEKAVSVRWPRPTCLPGAASHSGVASCGRRQHMSVATQVRWQGPTRAGATQTVPGEPGCMRSPISRPLCIVLSSRLYEAQRVTRHGTVGDQRGTQYNFVQCVMPCLPFFPPRCRQARPSPSAGGFLALQGFNAIMGPCWQLIGCKIECQIWHPSFKPRQRHPPGRTVQPEF